MARRKKITIFLMVLAALTLLLVLGAFQSMSREDTRHARFYNAGKTINDFLKGYCGDLEKSFAEGDANVLMSRYSSSYASAGRGRWMWEGATAEGGVTLHDLAAHGTDDYDRDDLGNEVDTYLDGLVRIDKTICKIDLIEDVELGKNATLTVKVIIDGIDVEQRHFQDRMFYRWLLINEPSAGEAHAWKIRRDELKEGIRVAGDARVFESVDVAALGIDFKHRRDPKLHMKKFQDDLKFGVIQHASGGLSAADYNGDGREDLFFLSGTECRLYRNLGTDETSTDETSYDETSYDETSDGKIPTPSFVDVTAETGLSGIDQAHVALFADYDNDGDRDLFVGRYLAASRYYKNNGPDQDGNVTFTEASAEMGVDFVEPVTSATLLDFDNDGDLDIYLAVNGNAFEAFPRLPFYAQNGQPNRLLRNEGGQGFTDVTEASGTGDVGWSLAVAASDFDADGYPDLAVANDFGRKNLYRNNGDGTFREMAKEAGVLDFSGGMGLTFGDFDDDGRVDLYTSNINSNQRWFGEDMTVTQYTRNVMRSQWLARDFLQYMSLYGLVGSSWPELGKQIGEGNSLFKNRGDGTFEELKNSHTDRAGWGWSVAFFDYDNDTDLDLYAANGWISNTPGTDL